jgi:hypothetical protein
MIVGLLLSFRRNTYLPSLKVCCVELDLEPGESLARSPSVPTTVAFLM